MLYERNFDVWACVVQRGRSAIKPYVIGRIEIATRVTSTEPSRYRRMTQGSW